jgi:hypothetical protein
MARHRRAHRSGRRGYLAGGFVFLLGGGGLIAAAGRRLLETEALQAVPSIPVPTSEPEPTPSPTPSPTPAPFDLSKVDPIAIVKIDRKGWHSWALIDHTTGAMIGSRTIAETARVCSIVKIWLAADYLRRAAEKRTTPSSAKLATLSKMIRYSDNTLATDLFAELGRSASLTRMKDLCKLTEFKAGTSWSMCLMSSRDVARLGACVATGTAAGPKWTEWLLNEMRSVRLGTWGIREAFPPDQAAKLAIKNGWDTTATTQTRHVNCLATTARWTLVAMTKYPIALSDRHGQLICKDVAAQLLQSHELEPLFGQ